MLSHLTQIDPRANPNPNEARDPLSNANCNL